MPKKPLYIPTEEDIYRLQEIKENNDVNNVDIYRYLVAKTIEKLIVDFEYLGPKELPVMELLEVIQGVCYVYPNEINNSEYAQYDADLCHKLLVKPHDDELTNLDHLARFAHSVQFNRQTVSMTIDMLDRKLKDNPKYRFTYKSSELLDAIFGVDYQEFLSLTYHNMVGLIHLDPIYILKFDPCKLIPEISYPDERITNYRLGMLLEEGISNYAARFGIGEHIGYDYRDVDMTNPKDEQVKKLIRYLHNK